MKKVKHPHRKALIRQKFQKRKPKVTYERCCNFYRCEGCPLNRAFNLHYDKDCYVFNN